ncbi:hypothetical protein N2152v2_007123 [Parachlorella kessleri]
MNLFIVLLVAVLGCVQPGLAVKQVAIVGGGVGGAASAYYLKSLLGDAVNITLFEQHDTLGGRTSSWKSGDRVDDRVYELGASIAWTGNHYLRFLAGEAGLSVHDISDSDSRLAVFDGSQLVFKESEWRLLTLLRLLWRYGLAYYQLRSHPSRMFARFEALYQLQDEGVAFDSPGDFLKQLGLYDLTQDSLFQYLREQFAADGYMQEFADEVVAGIGRTNYNQNNLQLNALAGLVSLLPSTDPQVFSIKGGNQQLAQKLVAKAGATVLTGVAVGEVAARTDGRFDVALAAAGCRDTETAQPWRPVEAGAVAAAAIGGKQQPQDLLSGGAGGSWVDFDSPDALQQRRLQAQQEVPDQLAGCSGTGRLKAAAAGGAGAQGPAYGPFDAVILAAPLELSGIAVSGVELPRIPPRKYQTTVTTIVEGELRPAYFGLPEEDGMPYTDILVTQTAQTPFSCIGHLGPGSSANSSVFKLFSSEPLEEDELGQIFEPGFRVLVTKSWRAYPRQDNVPQGLKGTQATYFMFDPPEDFSPFRLAEGLYYNNALENAASAMEIAAIAGRNTALLAAKQLSSC